MNAGNKNRPYDQGFPLYLTGDQSLLNMVKLRLETSITISALPQKTFIVGIPFKMLRMNQIKDSFYHPIAQVEIIGEVQRQNFIKNKNLIRQGVHYIYFPAGIRVDQKIYKIYLNNYQNLLDKLSRSQKLNFSKYIIWQEGKGEHSLNFQANKVIDGVSNTIKSQIQRKVEQATTEIRSIQSQKMGIKQLKTLFILKNKLSYIFKQVRLNQLSNDILQSLWRQILSERQLFLSKIAITKLNDVNSTKNIIEEQVFYPFKPPFLVQKLSFLVKGFQNPENYMSIVTFCFYQMFKSFVLSMQHYQAIIRLRFFIDTVNSNILKKATQIKIEVSRYIWLIELMDHCQQLIKNHACPPMKNTQEQYEKRQISIWGTHRYALERIGYILYELSNFNGFPRSLQEELLFVLQKIRNKHKKNISVRENPSLEIQKIIILKEQQPQSRQRQVSLNVLKVLSNFESYAQVYVTGLIKVYKALSVQSFYRTSQSLKLTVMKSIILYMYDSNLMHQYNYNFISNLQYEQFQKWNQLKTLHDIFKLPFLKVQNKNDEFRTTMIDILTNKQFCLNADLWKMLLTDLKQNYEQGKDRFLLGQIQSFNISRAIHPDYLQETQQSKIFEVKITLKNWQNRYFIHQKIWIICLPMKKQSENQQLLIPIEQCSIQKGVCFGKIKMQPIFIFKLKGILLQTQDTFFNFQITKKSQLLQKLFKLNISQIRCLNKDVFIYEQGLWTKISFSMKPNKANFISEFKFKGQSLELFSHLKINQQKQISTNELQNINLNSFLRENQINFDFFIRQKQRVHKASYYSSASAKKNTSKHQQSNLFFSFKFKVRHENQEYQIQINKSFSIELAIEASYNSVQQLEQYNLKNIAPDVLVVKQGNHEWEMQPLEELTLGNSKIECKPFDSIFSTLNLQDKIDIEDDFSKAKKCKHFFIQLQKQRAQSVNLFQKISIKSSQIGQLRLEAGEGYQVVGKIQGKITYQREDQIDLWIVPIRRGRIVLPEIWVDEKKGIWVNSPFIDVK